MWKGTISDLIGSNASRAAKYVDEYSRHTSGFSCATIDSSALSSSVHSGGERSMRISANTSGLASRPRLRSSASMSS